MWFGGAQGPGITGLRPVHSVLPDQDVPQLWTSPDWPNIETVLARHGSRVVAVLGASGAVESDVSSLAATRVPDDVVCRWPGSYTVLLITPEGVTLWTDPGGTRPVYLLAGQHGVLWASSSLLLASRRDYRPDVERLQAELAHPEPGENEPYRSWFADVRHVPPGHRVVLANDGSYTQQQIWEPRPVSANRVVRRLRQELAAAVTVRTTLSSRISTDFSGGFDSTALGLLAADQLNPHQHITGVTVHPSDVHHGGDLDYAREAGRHPGIRHRWFPLTDEHCAYRMLDQIPATDEPAPSTTSYAYFSGQMSWLQHSLGSDAHMTGDGGDALLLTPPCYLGDLLRRGNVLRSVREAAKWAHIRSISLWTALRHTLRSAESPSSPPDWLRTAPPPNVTDNSGTSRTRRDLLTAVTHAGRTAHADTQLAVTFGIRLHNPYLDARVIDTYLGLPLRAFPGPTHYKPILAAAMRDLFPSCLVRRVTKGDATSDHLHGFRTALPQLYPLMDGHLAALDLLDVRRLHRAMTRVSAGIEAEHRAVEAAVVIEVWLRSLRTAPSIRWHAPSPEVRTS